MENVVVSIFSVESEAYQAFSELRQQPEGEWYNVYEAALLKCQDGITVMQDCFTIRPVDNAEAGGILLGSLVGILGGPLGVLLGASYGALVGGSVDMVKAADNLTMVEVLTGKIYEGEIAIVALVTEEEPEFDKAFAAYETTNLRYDAAAILEEVDHAYEVQAEMNRQAMKQLREERKVEREERREARRAYIKQELEDYGATISEGLKSMGYE